VCLAQEAQTRFLFNYQTGLRSDWEGISLTVMVWGPGVTRPTQMAVKRHQIKNRLLEVGHNPLFSEDIKGDDDPLHAETLHPCSPAQAVKKGDHMTEPDVFEWQLAAVVTDERLLFILWAVKTLLCTRREDFLREYEFDPRELDALLERLQLTNFLQEDGGELVLTNAGNIAVSQLDTAPVSPARANLARPAEDIQARFNLPKERIYVEDRLLEQLRDLHWSIPLGRDPDTPYLEAEGRTTYRDVLLKVSLKRAIRKFNTGPGRPEPTEQQLDEAIKELEQVQSPGSGLLEANRKAMDLLLAGVDVTNTPDAATGAYRRLRLLALPAHRL